MKKVILYCSSGAWGGLEHMVLNLALWARQEQKFAVILVCSENTTLAQEAALAGLDPIFVHRSSKYVDIKAAKALLKIVKINAYAPVVVAHNNDLDMAAWARIFGQKLFSLWYWQHMRVGIPKRGLAHFARQKQLTGWIAPLPYLATETLRNTWLPKEKVFIVPHGIDTHRYKENASSQANARSKLSLPDGVIIMGLLGRLDRQKRQDVAIKALSKLPAHVHLAIMGAPTHNQGHQAYYQELINAAQKLGLEKRIYFLPFAQDVTLFYQAIDIVLMPTHNETYGLVTVEALASAKPVVGHNSAGTTEILKNGAYGYLYNQDADLADTIQLVLSNRDNATKKALLGQADVIKHRDKTQMLVQLEKLLLPS